MHTLDALEHSSMSSPILSYKALANFTPLLSHRVPSPQSIAFSPGSISLPVSSMKDVSSSTRHPRPTAYPKKRPSPHGVSKSHKAPLLPAPRRSPVSAKTAIIKQRQREAQILQLRREGVLLEEEYHNEIRAYMHEMEVSVPQQNDYFRMLVTETCRRETRCRPFNRWINNLK